MDPSQSAKRPRLSMGDSNELVQLLVAAFPDNPERAEIIYIDASEDPQLAGELLRAPRLPTARGDVKGAVERGYGRWQARRAEETINQRTDRSPDLQNATLELIRTNPD